MVPMAQGRKIEVPFYTRLFDEPELDIAQYLESFLTAKTVALYLNTPNNPSGKVLDSNQLRQIARRRNQVTRSRSRAACRFQVPASRIFAIASSACSISASVL